MLAHLPRLPRCRFPWQEVEGKVGPCGHPRARGCRPVLDMTFRYANGTSIIVSSVVLVPQACWCVYQLICPCTSCPGVPAEELPATAQLRLRSSQTRRCINHAAWFSGPFVISGRQQGPVEWPRLTQFLDTGQDVLLRSNISVLTSDTVHVQHCFTYRRPIHEWNQSGIYSYISILLHLACLLLLSAIGLLVHLRPPTLKSEPQALAVTLKCSCET